MSCKIRRKVSKKPVTENVVLTEDKIDTHAKDSQNQKNIITLINLLYGAETKKLCENIKNTFYEIWHDCEITMEAKISKKEITIPNNVFLIDYNKLTEYMTQKLFGDTKIRCSRSGVDIVTLNPIIPGNRHVSFDTKSVFNNDVHHGHGKPDVIEDELTTLLQVKNKDEFISKFRNICVDNIPPKNTPVHKHITDILILIQRIDYKFVSCFIAPFICCIHLNSKGHIMLKNPREVKVFAPIICTNVSDLMKKFEGFSHRTKETDVKNN